MIKKYIEFIKESREDYDVPSHFVELKSIVHYLDTNTGKLYAMYKDGGYDEEPYDYDDNSEGLSESDKKLVESFRTSAEELIKDKINLDLFQDIMDRSISEGLVDDRACVIDIYALVRTPDVNSIIVLRLNFKNNNEDYIWYRLFKKDAEFVKNISIDDIYYSCYFRYNKEYDEEFFPKIELIKKIIKSDYPDVYCTIIPLMNNY